MKTFLLFSAAMGAATVHGQIQPAALPLWEVGLFGGVASTPAYPASSDRSVRALVLPFLVYRGDVLRVDRGSAGARVVRTDNLELDVGFAASLPASSNDIPARKDMPDLGTLIEFGPRLKITLAQPTPNSQWRLDLPLRTVLEFNSGVHAQGLAFEPQLSYEVRDVGAGWSASASASVVLGDSRLNQYFYGVPASFATATRPAYEAHAGLITSRFTLTTSKSINPDLRIFGFVRYDLHTGAANRDSPLFLQSNGNSVGLALTWTLGRSAELARN